MALTADITTKAPTIGLSFLINGCQGTLALIAELLQPESPLIADILIVLAQVSLGAHVDSREGPPGTGKSHVKGLLQLVIEILKLTRVDQPKLGKDLTIMQSAQNAAVIEFISTIYKIVGPDAPMTGSTGILHTHTLGMQTLTHNKHAITHH